MGVCSYLLLYSYISKLKKEVLTFLTTYLYTPDALSPNGNLPPKGVAIAPVSPALPVQALPFSKFHFLPAYFLSPILVPSADLPHLWSTPHPPLQSYLHTFSSQSHFVVSSHVTTTTSELHFAHSTTS